MTTETEDITLVQPRLVRLAVERAEQACRYAVKHQDFADSLPEYANGFKAGAAVCEGAIRDHIERHSESILGPEELTVEAVYDKLTEYEKRRTSKENVADALVALFRWQNPPA